MEKIKISLSSYTYQILLKDMDAFKILKENGELNRNDFFNRIIINYMDEYTMENNEQVDVINRIVDKYVSIDEMDKINLSNELIKNLRENYFFHNTDEKSVIVNIKPTKASEDVIIYLLDRVIKNQSISSYFRQMFDSYANLTQNMRERIIFKDNFEKLIKSLEKGKKVFITLRNKKTFTGSLYAICDSKEEMYNYCLFELENNRSTVRLASISAVKIINEPVSFKEENEPLFDFQMKNCVQTTVSPRDFDMVKVYLTNEGIKLYDKMYAYRPQYVKKEVNNYFFIGSHDQILSYFRRFGRNALILEPDYLRLKMEAYYKDSYYSYEHISRQKKRKENKKVQHE